MTENSPANRQNDDLVRLIISVLSQWSIVIAWIALSSLAMLGSFFVSGLAIDGLRLSPFVSSVVCILSVGVVVAAVARFKGKNRIQAIISLGSLALLNVVLWSICVASAWAIMPILCAVFFFVSLAAIGTPGLIGIRFKKEDSEVASELNNEESSVTLPLELFESQSNEEQNVTVIQSFCRSISDGIEIINGTWRVDFLEGQKTAVVHVPFWPPIEGINEVECEVVSEGQCDIKVGRILANGIRFELKRNKSSKQETVVVEWTGVLGEATSQETNHNLPGKEAL